MYITICIIAKFCYVSSASTSSVKVPRLAFKSATTSEVTFQVLKGVDASETKPLVAGYEVFRFGVPMIGEYVNAGTGREVTIRSAVAGAPYKIAAWALDDMNQWKSATSAMLHATARVASEPIAQLTVFIQCMRLCMLKAI